MISRLMISLLLLVSILSTNSSAQQLDISKQQQAYGDALIAILRDWQNGKIVLDRSSVVSTFDQRLEEFRGRQMTSTTLADSVMVSIVQPSAAVRAS